MTNKEALESLMDNAENGYVDIEEVKFVFAEMQSNSDEDCISRAETMTEIMMFAGNVKLNEEDIYIKVSDAVQLLRELPPVTPKQMWIPVNEKLPDVGQVVIVTDDRGKVFEYELNPLDVDKYTTGKWRFLEHEIIAWQPLPEPYKAEKE